MLFARRIAKACLTVLVMVMVLCAMTVSASHLDDLASDGGTVIKVAHVAGHDADGSHSKKAPHSCCSAHSVSVKPVTLDHTAAYVQTYSSVVHTAYQTEVIPNQFLQGLFRPPRILA